MLLTHKIPSYMLHSLVYLLPMPRAGNREGKVLVEIAREVFVPGATYFSGRSSAYVDYFSGTVFASQVGELPASERAALMSRFDGFVLY